MKNTQENTSEQISLLLNELNLTDLDGELIFLDSLALIDLVSQLEMIFNISISLPLAFKAFNSTQAVIDLVWAVIQQQSNQFNVSSQPSSFA